MMGDDERVMTPDEINDAANALIQWMRTQGISPFDAIGVVATVLWRIQDAANALTEGAD